MVMCYCQLIKHVMSTLAGQCLFIKLDKMCSLIVLCFSPLTTALLLHLYCIVLFIYKNKNLKKCALVQWGRRGLFLSHCGLCEYRLQNML